MAVGIGQRCLVRVKIMDVELRNARDIVATVESPQYVAHCQEVSFDEVSGLVYVAVDVNSAGSYSMWLEVRFAKEVVYTPAFVFAEVEGEAAPCESPYIVDVEVSGESVSVTPPKIDVDAVTREEFEQLAENVAGKVDKSEFNEEVANINNAIEHKATTDGNYPEMTVGKAQGVVGISQVQEALTLTTKPNGNIVIGNLAGQSKEFMPATPSGDPLHDAYVSAGATWVPSTQTWTVNTVEGITNNEMRNIYNRGPITMDMGQLAGGGSNPSAIRVNLRSISSVNYSNSILARNLAAFARGNTTIEVINLSGDVVGTYENIIGATSLYYAFYGCSKLRRINGAIQDFLSGDISVTVFQGCAKLETIKLLNLKHNANFQDSPLLSQASILYMIKKAAPTSAIEITLHPTAYAMAMEDSEIKDALTAQPLVTLASA